jgi:hypothetical protein
MAQVHKIAAGRRPLSTQSLGANVGRTSNGIDPKLVSLNNTDLSTHVH